MKLNKKEKEVLKRSLEFTKTMCDKGADRGTSPQERERFAKEVSTLERLEKKVDAEKTAEE